MIGYVKLKTENKELYENNFMEKNTENKELYQDDLLKKLKNKNTKLSKLQYNICYFFYQLIIFMKYFGNIITVKKFYNAYIFIFPFHNKSNKSISKRKLKKCINKLQKLIKKYKVSSLVFSNELLVFSKEFKKITNTKAVASTTEHSQNISFLNENILMPYLIKEILSYVLEIKQSKTELEDLYICIKEANRFNIENIYYLSNYFKTINIVTPNINSFQKIVDKLEQNGALITLANNKEKSLKKSKLIVNFDFTREELLKYTIYRRAIIISMKENEAYNNLGFEGIEIKNVQIDISKEIKNIFKKNFLLENFSLCALYKCLLNENSSFEVIKQKMQEDKIIIKKLYGNNGEISYNEYLKVFI